jgi:hypothetical protein
MISLRCSTKEQEDKGQPGLGWLAGWLAGWLDSPQLNFLLLEVASVLLVHKHKI